MQNPSGSTVNELFKNYADKDIQLVVRKLDKDDADETECVLIGGRTDELRFLRDLIDALIHDAADDGFEISPTGPGCAYFSAKASTALYFFKNENSDA